MAVAFVTATTGSANASSVTFSHTVSSGSDYLLAGCGSRGTGIPTGATWDGAAMSAPSAINECTAAAGNARRHCALFGIVNPGVKTADVVISLAASNNVAAGAASFSGVDQTTPNGTPVEDDIASGDAIGDTFSSATDDLGWDVTGSGNFSPVADGSQTERWAQHNAFAVLTRASSLAAGASTTTMGWTFTSNTLGATWIGMAIKASGGAPAADAVRTHHFTLLGVGA